MLSWCLANFEFLHFIFPYPRSWTKVLKTKGSCFLLKVFRKWQIFFSRLDSYFCFLFRKSNFAKQIYSQNGDKINSNTAFQFHTLPIQSVQIQCLKKDFKLEWSILYMEKAHFSWWRLLWCSFDFKWTEAVIILIPKRVFIGQEDAQNFKIHYINEIFKAYP